MFQLHPKQGVAFFSAATKILYGGAAGGGKSHPIRAAAMVALRASRGLLARAAIHQPMKYPAVSFDHRVGTGEQLPKRTLSEFAVVP
jgi:hypothetical protein